MEELIEAINELITDDTSPDYDQAIYDVKKVLIQYQNDMDEEVECLTALLTKFGCVNEGYCDECSGQCPLEQPKKKKRFLSHASSNIKRNSVGWFDSLNEAFRR